MLESGDCEALFQEPNFSYIFLGTNGAALGKTQKLQTGNLLRNKEAGDHTFIFLDILNLCVDAVKDFMENRGPELRVNGDLTEKPEFAEICVNLRLFLN